jgi:hypothetical protein
LASVAISQAFPFLKEFSDAKFSSESLISIIGHPSPPVDIFAKNSGAILSKDKIKGVLRFQNIYFSYPSREKHHVNKFFFFYDAKIFQFN